MSHHGHFCWYDLMTTDIAAAVAFYKSVLGWTVDDWQAKGGAMPYAHVHSAQGGIGGITLLPPELKAMGAPPYWTGYVLVDDVDATAAKAVALGGKLHFAMDLPGTGRFATIADPDGATIALFKPEKDAPLHDASKPGEFNWRELMTTDNHKAFAFYQALFGWQKLDEMDMGAMGSYLLYGLDGKQFGGMMKRPPEMPVSAWGYYVMVADLDAALARATAEGGKLLNGPMPVPGPARIVHLLDPQGAFIALVGM